MGRSDVVASKSARERKAAVEVGPQGLVKIDLEPDGQFRYRVACRSCAGADGKAWSTLRRGGDNGYMAAMDRWIFHLVENHRDSDAPCLAYLREAYERLEQRRDQ